MSKIKLKVEPTIIEPTVIKSDVQAWENEQSIELLEDESIELSEDEMK
jgi:hypothetical protein